MNLMEDHTPQCDEDRRHFQDAIVDYNDSDPREGTKGCTENRMKSAKTEINVSKQQVSIRFFLT
jgi:hypothetical protein